MKSPFKNPLEPSEKVRPVLLAHEMMRAQRHVESVAVGELVHALLDGGVPVADFGGDGVFDVEEGKGFDAGLAAGLEQGGLVRGPVCGGYLDVAVADESEAVDPIAEFAWQAEEGGVGAVCCCGSGFCEGGEGAFEFLRMRRDGGG